jgi:dolichol kinase
MRTKDYPWDLPSKKYHQSDHGVNTSLQPLFFLIGHAKTIRVLESQQNNTSSCHIHNETGSSPRRIFRLGSTSVSYAAGILVALNVFPEPVNYAAISTLTLGYGLSSLVGMRLGRHHICYNQSKILIPVISGICMSMLFLFM